MNIFRKFRASLLLREAILKANKAWLATGERHYVMPNSSGKPQLIVMDRKNFRILKRKGYIDGNAIVHNLINESFYFTPYRNGNGYLSDSDRIKKANSFFQWYDLRLKSNHRPR